MVAGVVVNDQEGVTKVVMIHGGCGRNNRE